MNHEHHHHNATSELTFHEKTVKILEHWIKHNIDHAENYTKWANDVKDNNIDSIVSELLKEAADLTLAINDKFTEAIKRLKK